MLDQHRGSRAGTTGLLVTDVITDRSIAIIEEAVAHHVASS
jgi:hypothetical protein